MGKSLFISFEGIDGSGKSTQVRKLAEALTSEGYEVVVTREPGGSVGAEEIRKLILTGDPGRWSAETELLLFNAARRDHLEKTIWPALEVGKIVITDRFADSTRVYQGVTRGDLRAKVDALHAEMIGVEPDLTIVLDMEPRIGLDRALIRMGGANASQAEDRFEKMGSDFQVKLRAGYLDIAATYKTRCSVVDASGTIDEVFGRVYQVVVEKLMVN